MLAFFDLWRYSRGVAGSMAPGSRLGLKAKRYPGYVSIVWHDSWVFYCCWGMEKVAGQASLRENWRHR